MQAIDADTRHRRLLSPAETMNGITVAATHEDSSALPKSPHLIDPFVSPNLPSVYNAQGPGYRRSVKPEILLPGGRQFMTEKLGTSHVKATLELDDASSLPGQRVAVPGNGGLLNQTLHVRGTSNAAALASRAAISILEMIEDLRRQPDCDIPEQYEVVLAKALLVHSASRADSLVPYREALGNAQNSSTFRDDIGRFLGYGPVEPSRVLACSEQRVTVLGFGELEDGQGAEFRFPLPPQPFFKSFPPSPDHHFRMVDSGDIHKTGLSRGPPLVQSASWEKDRAPRCWRDPASISKGNGSTRSL